MFYGVAKNLQVPWNILKNEARGISQSKRGLLFWGKVDVTNEGYLATGTWCGVPASRRPAPLAPSRVLPPEGLSSSSSCHRALETESNPCPSPSFCSGSTQQWKHKPPPSSPLSCCFKLHVPVRFLALAHQLHQQRNTDRLFFTDLLLGTGAIVDCRACCADPRECPRQRTSGVSRGRGRIGRQYLCACLE